MDKSIFLHGSTGKDLVQSTVFELFDLDLPAELLRILELGLRCSSRTDTANDRLIIEFKSHLKNIVKDFDDARKVFDEMDYIVCWEVTDDDAEKLHQLSITIERLDEVSLFSRVPMHISCCTHRLLINANVTPVYIIDLKRFLNSLC